MDDIQRQPTAHKNCDHSDEHVVGSLFALGFQFVPLSRPAAAADLDLDPLLEGQRDHCVAERDNATRHNILQHETGHREELACLGSRPLLGTRVAVAVVSRLLHLVVDAQRQRDGHRDDPDGDNHQHAHVYLHARLERVHDHEIPVHCDCRGRQRRHVDADAENHGDDVTQPFPEDPRIEKV